MFGRRHADVQPMLPGLSRVVQYIRCTPDHNSPLSSDAPCMSRIYIDGWLCLHVAASSYTPSMSCGRSPSRDILCKSASFSDYIAGLQLCGYMRQGTSNLQELLICFEVTFDSGAFKGWVARI